MAKPVSMTTADPAVRAEAQIIAVQVSTEQALTAARSVEITSAETYQSADLTLFQIRQAKQTVEQKMDAELNIPIIEPARRALDGLYELRRKLLAKLHTPLETAEKMVKGKMAAWQTAERKRVEEEREAVRREDLRLAQEAEKAKRQAELANTESARKRATEEAELLERQRAQVRATTVAGPVKGTGSKVTVVKTWKVTDMTAFIAAVAAGEVPEIVLEVNAEVMNTYFADDRAVVSAWPGVEIEEVTRIAGR